MSGAYVAKPEVIPPVVYPPPWNPNWPYPGPPFPPGYSPVITMTADAVIVPGNSTKHVDMKLSDWGKETTAPSGLATWTATLDGAPLTLGYSPSALLYSVDTAYGVTPSFYFAIGSGDDKKTIELTVKGSPYPSNEDGSNLTTSAYIAVSTNDSWKIILTVTVTSKSGIVTFATDIDSYKGDLVEYGSSNVDWRPEYGTFVDATSNFVASIPSENVMKIESLSLVETLQELYIQVNPDSTPDFGGSGTATANAKFYKGSELKHEYTKVFTGPTGLFNWITFNKTTGTVTEH